MATSQKILEQECGYRIGKQCPVSSYEDVSREGHRKLACGRKFKLDFFKPER